MRARGAGSVGPGLDVGDGCKAESRILLGFFPCLRTPGLDGSVGGLAEAG